MHVGNRAGRRHRRAAYGIAGLALAALMVAGCTSGSGGGNNASGKSGGDGSGPTTPAAPPVSISVTPAASSAPVSPTTPIVVKATNGTLSNVTVTNPTKGTTVTGAFSPDKTTWTSNEALGYGTTYQVDATGTGKDGKTTDQKGSVTTLTPKAQVEPNMIPAPASVAGTGVGVGQPIVFQFDKPVKNKAVVQAALTVTSTPAQPGAWYWIDDKDVHYRPENFWLPGTKIHVVAKTYGLDFGNGIYGAEDRDETYHVHDSWVAKADGNTEQMQIFHNGALVNTLPISMGKDSTPTHVGIHVISAKNQTVEMNSCTYGVCPPDPRAYDATEYWAERISNDGEFVHENPHSDAQQGHSNVSHGCINLNEQNAQWFFNNLGPGDVVEVANSGGPQLPLWDLYGDWSVPWAQWQAGNA